MNMRHQIEALTATQREKLAKLLTEKQAVAAPSQLVAYVVTDQMVFPTSAELRTYLQDRLPAYMTPAHFVFLDALPQTPNGKLDRRALPDPDPAWNTFDNEFVAPESETERAIAAIWADLLGFETIGVHDDFFELGGHSLLVTQLVSRLRRTFGLELPLNAVLDVRTIAGQAERIDTLQWATRGAIDSDDDREDFEI